MIGSNSILGSIPTASEPEAQAGPPGPPGANGAISYADGIVTGAVQLSTLAAAALDPDSLAWVNSVGAYFRLADGSALTVDNLTVVTASGRAGAQWIRLDLYNKQWEAQAAWFVDPQNTYGTSSDENTGATSATALRSYRELARRLFNATITAAPLVVTCRSNLVAGDTPAFTFRVGSGGSVRFDGVPTVIYTGVVTTTAAQAAGAAADDNRITDATIPVSFTASGLLANAILFTRTNGTAAYWWGAKDLGGAPPAAALRISSPAALTGGPLALVAADTYTGSTLPTIGNLQFPLAAPGSVTYRFLNHVPGVNNTRLGAVLYSHSWITAPNLSVHLAPGNQVNIGIDSSGATTNFLVADGTSGNAISRGLWRGSGTTQFAITASTSFVSFNGPTLQAARLRAISSSNISVTVRLSIHDTSAEAIFAEKVNLAFSGTGCLGGMGNTGRLIRVSNGAHVSTEVVTPWVAGSTTDATPIGIDGVAAYTVAQVGAGPFRLESFVEFPQAKRTVANGAQVVAIGGTGPAAIITPGAPAGWETFYDAAGVLSYRPYWQ